MSCARFALAAAERGKPIVAYKLGRSAAARELAVSHTGALAGEDDVADCVLRRLRHRARWRRWRGCSRGCRCSRRVPVGGGRAAAPAGSAW